MESFLCKLVLLTRVFLATSVGLNQDFVMITYLSNKVLKNHLKEVSQSSSRSLLDCSTQCGRCCSCFGFNTLTKMCRAFKRCNKADVTEYQEGWIYHSIKEFHELGKPGNCQDILDKGFTTSGIFTIYYWDECDKDWRAVEVLCDMGTMDGGWTVLQRRINGLTNFNRSWSEYKTGFGNLVDDFWIGNEFIHQLTRNENVTLYVAITLNSGVTKYQVYRRFSVADEVDKFRLFLQEPTDGTLGDSMTMADNNIATSHGMPFSTYDKYNGPIPSCTSLPYDNGGWWFNKCRYSYLNGFWRDTYWVWYPIAEFKGDERGTLMMIRPN